jgi:hypothetical protein
MKPKNIIKWVLLIPLFTALIVIVNLILNAVLGFINIGCVDNFFIECSQAQAGLLNIIWFDIVTILIGLNLSLMFIGEKHYKSAFVALSVWRLVSLALLGLGNNFELSKLLVYYLPSVLAFGFIGYRVFNGKGLIDF